ncbi:hypothetical protein ACQPXM_17645 [Kribbella sp. CA-253562]|uniref:hypothetical protein n=1 Tax=Kribbella sp. CA-253562 TaxID=3239942 RepID=UPI003D92219F
MRSHTRAYGLCLVRVEPQRSHVLITVVTDYARAPSHEHRAHYFSDVDTAAEAVRAFLLSCLAAEKDE